YWCFGFFLTGVTLLVIGLALGRIGRAARHAELPPPEVTQAEAQAEQNAAARAPIVAPTNPATPLGAPPVQGAHPGVPGVPTAPAATPVAAPGSVAAPIPVAGVPPVAGQNQTAVPAQ